MRGGSEPASITITIQKKLEEEIEKNLDIAIAGIDGAYAKLSDLKDPKKAVPIGEGTPYAEIDFGKCKTSEVYCATETTEENNLTPENIKLLLKIIVDTIIKVIQTCDIRELIFEPSVLIKQKAALQAINNIAASQGAMANRIKEKKSGMLAAAAVKTRKVLFGTSDSDSCSIPDYSQRLGEGKDAIEAQIKKNQVKVESFVLNVKTFFDTLLERFENILDDATQKEALIKHIKDFETGPVKDLVFGIEGQSKVDEGIQNIPENLLGLMTLIVPILSSLEYTSVVKIFDNEYDEIKVILLNIIKCFFVTDDSFKIEIDPKDDSYKKTQDFLERQKAETEAERKLKNSAEQTIVYGTSAYPDGDKGPASSGGDKGAASSGGDAAAIYSTVNRNLETTGARMINRARASSIMRKRPLPSPPSAGVSGEAAGGKEASVVTEAPGLSLGSPTPTLRAQPPTPIGNVHYIGRVEAMKKLTQPKKYLLRQDHLGEIFIKLSAVSTDGNKILHMKFTKDDQDVTKYTSQTFTIKIVDGKAELLEPESLVKIGKTPVNLQPENFIAPP